MKNESPTTKLRPPWVKLARLTWVLLTAVTVILFVVGTIDQLRQPPPSCVEPSDICVYWTMTQEDLAVAQTIGWNPATVRAVSLGGVWFIKLTFMMITFLVFWRRSDDWMALLLTATLNTFLLEGIGSVGFELSPATIILLLGGVSFFILPFIFPNGRIEPGWARWATLLVLAMVIGQFIVFEIIFAIAFIWLPLAAYAIIYRFKRVATAVEKQQIKWVMGGFLIWGVLFLIQTTIGYFFPVNQPTEGRILFLLFIMFPLYSLSLLALPATIAIAILRYRLWDIDIIIRRTLVYTILTGLLIGLYWGSVVVVQAVVNEFSGRSQSSQLSIALSTLLIAALFSPLRSRVQSFIDRRFYRHKYDAAQMLAQFANSARDEVDVDRLSAALLGVVEQTMHPQKTSVWIKPLNGRKRGFTR